MDILSFRIVTDACTNPVKNVVSAVVELRDGVQCVSSCGRGIGHRFKARSPVFEVHVLERKVALLQEAHVMWSRLAEHNQLQNTNNNFWLPERSTHCHLLTWIVKTIILRIWTTSFHGNRRLAWNLSHGFMKKYSRRARRRFDSISAELTWFWRSLSLSLIFTIRHPRTAVLVNSLLN